MLTQLNFNFTDKTSLKFKFDLNEENVEQIATEISINFEKRNNILKTKAANYFKKSAVLSSRKFSMDIFIENKYVKTIFSNIETSNKLAKDTEALRELLIVLCFEAIDANIESLSFETEMPENEKPVKINLPELRRYRRTTEDGETVYFNSAEDLAKFDNFYHVSQ